LNPKFDKQEANCLSCFFHHCKGDLILLCFIAIWQYNDNSSLNQKKIGFLDRICNSPQWLINAKCQRRKALSMVWVQMFGDFTKRVTNRCWSYSSTIIVVLSLLACFSIHWRPLEQGYNQRAHIMCAIITLKVTTNVKKTYNGVAKTHWLSQSPI